MTDIPDEIYTEVEPVINSVASDIRRRYYRFPCCEHEDFAQQGWLFVCQHPEKMLQWYDRSAYSERDSERLLARSLRNELTRYGEEQKAAALGYSTEDLYYYNRGEVRDLLPAMFDPDAWLDHGLPANTDEEEEERERRRKTVVLSQGYNWVATLADISRAFDRLDKSDRDLLTGFHKDGWSNNMMAESYGVSKQTMSDWHDRAIKRLVDLLGGPRPAWTHDENCQHDWQGRRAISNEGARAAQSGYYDE